MNTGGLKYPSTGYTQIGALTQRQDELRCLGGIIELIYLEDDTYVFLDMCKSYFYLILVLYPQLFVFWHILTRWDTTIINM